MPSLMGMNAANFINNISYLTTYVPSGQPSLSAFDVSFYIFKSLHIDYH